MDDRSQSSRPSGLPRPSRLPMSSSATTSNSTSNIARPSSSASVSSSARPMNVRPKPSRESLGGGELRNPKLRAAPSRDRLSLQPAAKPAIAPALSPSSSTSNLSIPKAPLRHPSPRTRAVSGQYVKAPPRLSNSTTAPAPPSSRPANDGDVFKRPAAAGTLSRRTSLQQLARHSPSPSISHPTSPDESQDVILEEQTAAPATLRAKTSKPRLSLAERTIETLSQIPSSPAVKGKTSAFFDSQSARFPQPRPGSRTSAGSRPGSSHHSDSSNKSTSRPSSRPSSSHDSSIPNFRSSTSSFRPAGQSSIAPIDELSTPGRVPPTRTLRGRASIGPGVGAGQRYGGVTSLRQQAENLSTLPPPRSRTPSPEKKSTLPAATPLASNRTATGPGKFASKTLAARPAKPRASVGGLFRKPSASHLESSSASAATPVAARKSSMTSRASSTSYEETNPSSASTVSTALSVDSADAPGQSPVTNSRKSSAALREQIAKAKAAKRAAAQQSARDDQEPASPTSPADTPVASFATTFAANSEETPVIPTDNTFDFGLDPFNQNRSGQSQAKVVQARVAAARTSGRLNIAALSLREIPSEVMNMYDAESMGTYDGSWAESVDLTRFVAADNEIEMIDESVFPDQSPEELAAQEDSQGNIFGGLETLDLHGNMLICLPMGLRRLSLLTSLNLSQNRITNNALEVISQITSLRDLKLGGNLFYGPLDPSFTKLENLEIVDLHGNNISALPLNMGNMTKLRILNISENNFESLVFEPLSKLPLTELNARKNKLSGVLIEDAVSSMPSLQILDVTSNQVTHLVSESRQDKLELPALQQLLVSMNRLQMLPDMGAWTNLLTLVAEENNINSIPDGFTSLATLRHADFNSNDIRVIPPEVGRMENLAMLRLSGNPLRDKKFCTATTDEVKAILASRLEPEPEPEPETIIDIQSRELNEELRDAVTELSSQTGTHHRQRSRKLSGASIHDDSRSDDDFATPPTSLPHTPARSRSHTLTNQLWPVKPGGVLDRSETDSSALHPVIASKVAQEHTVSIIYLQRNLFTVLPDSLSFFSATLTVLSLARNQLTGEAYLGDAAASDGLDLPVLKELNLASNHITGLGPLVRNLRAPALQKLDVSLNRVSSLPPDNQLRSAFPNLTVLLAGNNHLADLDPDSIEGLRVVDVSNNDIEHLNPRLGLLGGTGGLERLDVLGNRFRVPRFNVIERGTEATLRWLRGRVPVAEMGAWREANQRNGFDDDVD